MKFVASCSCKTWVGYATDEAAVRALGEIHVGEMERSLTPIQHDGAHVLTVRPDSSWNY